MKNLNDIFIENFKNNRDDISFSFGKNWKEFIEKYFNEARVAISMQHILDFLQMPGLNGKSFLDIGCGSGLSSLSAWLSSAGKVVSFDVDAQAVKTTGFIRTKVQNPSNWIIEQGSILDKNFISSLGKFDIVYAWGSLHHTGSVWQAVENAAGLLKTGGLFYLALYEKTGKSDYWVKVKRKYNKASNAGKKSMECRYILFHLILPYLIKIKNPFRYIKSYKQKRGMSYLTDVKDWLGGYPCEFVKIEEVLNFCRKKFNLELINIKTGEACVEYLFASKP